MAEIGSTQTIIVNKDYSQTNQVNANKHWAKHPSNQVNANKHISDEYYGFQCKRTLSGRKKEIS